MIGLPASARRAFVALLLAQFLGAVADHALLIAAIGLLSERAAPGWMTPGLRVAFYVAFVALGPFAGALADAFSKSRIIVLTNVIKLAGCMLLLAGLAPLLAFALMGLGAAVHGPARYGILPELLPMDELMLANAWLETATVGAILGGVALGSFLVDPTSGLTALGTPARSATALTSLVFLCAVGAALAVPHMAASNPHALRDPRRIASRFAAACTVLWSDRAAGRSLGATALFWACAAVLQLAVLRWGTDVLGLSLSEAALLQGALAVGVIGGAAAAARFVPIERAMVVMPLGLGIGALVVAMLWMASVWMAAATLCVIGLLAGALLVPMNALLQARGSRLMHPGQSVSVQSFFENGASFILLAAYGVLNSWQLPLPVIVGGLGLLVMAATLGGLDRKTPRGGG